MPKPKMTVEQFMKRLAKHKGEFELCSPKEFIRTPGVDAEGGIVHCPITRVCLAITGENFPTEDCRRAAERIGLNPKVLPSIIGGADNYCARTIRVRKTYRRRMLKILGLREEAI